MAIRREVPQRAANRHVEAEMFDYFNRTVTRSDRPDASMTLSLTKPRPAPSMTASRRIGSLAIGFPSISHVSGRMPPSAFTISGSPSLATASISDRSGGNAIASGVPR